VEKFAAPFFIASMPGADQLQWPPHNGKQHTITAIFVALDEDLP